MADAEKSRKTVNDYNELSKPVFWASTGKSDKQETVVPGVNMVGNMRPRVKGGKTKEVRAYIPVKQPIVETTDLHGTKTSFGITSDLSTVDTDISNLKDKRVSLRDLCVEDKKRVANLIKELARVVEEKENAENNLASERNHYQEQILKLVEQQETVLKEREDVQNKLLEYQNLIVKLQQEQQLHHLKRQQERQRKLQQKSPTKEANVDTPVPSDSVQGVRTRKSISTGRNAAQKDFPQPLSQPKPEAQAGFDENSRTSDEEDEKESPAELPSKNLYMNTLEDSGVEDFSTQAHPAVSPPHGNEHPTPLSYRPFTAMIDRELAKQHAALTSMDCMLEDHNALQRKEEIHARKTDTQFNAKTSKETNSPVRMNTNPKDGTLHMNQEKRNRNCNVKEVASNSDFVFPSHPFVSPEKAEIFSRFMQGQSNDGHHQRHGDLKLSERDLRLEEQKKSMDLTGTRKQRKKKPPPATYGVLHPPIMSSTQKSSEIGDYVNSTINSDRKIAAVKDPWHNVNKKNEESDEGSEDVDGHKVISQPEDENVDVEENANDRAGSMKRTKKSKHRGKPKVEFSDQLATSKDFQAKTFEADNLLGVDPDYLSYYKNLSGTERKKELLKQRTKLLEEQNKLRKILAEQEHRLMFKQAEVVAKREVIQDIDEQGGKVTTSKAQDSLEEMELRVALKEEAVRKEKELLVRRRREQTERLSTEIKSMETDAGHCQGSDDHCKKQQPENESHANARISPQENLGTGNEILNRALILAEGEGVAVRNVTTGGWNVQEETHRAVKENKSKLVTESSDHQSKQPVSGQVNGSRTTATKSALAASNNRKEDELARRLEYSFHSDTDQPVLDSALDVKPQSQSVPNREAMKSKSASAHSNLESHEGKVDAGTSISFAHFGQNVSGIQDGDNINSVERSAATETKHLTQSPGDKTMAVIEIINSLDDLDNLHTSKGNSLPPKSMVVKSRQEASNRRTKVLTKKCSSRHATCKQDLIKPHIGARFSKSGQVGHSVPSTNITTNSLSHAFGPVRRRERFGHHQGPGFKLFPLGHMEDSELDFFHLPQFREERLEGCRRLANRDTDDDDESDDITYEYDANDDSNLDDIVNALSRSFSSNEEKECGGRGVDDVWESVGSYWDDGYNLEFEDNLESDAECISLDENLNFESDGQKKYADDNEILEEIFFVHP